MKSLHRLSTALFLLISAAALWAQTPVGVGGGAGSGSGSVGGVIVSTTVAPVFQAIVPGIQGLKGVPFSADTVNVFTRVLPDGNHINRETHGKTFRDSEGRTRRETEFEMPSGSKRVSISIVDPVQQLSVSLDPQAKTARVYHFKPPATSDRVASLAPNRLAATSVPPRASMERVSLGTREIEGFTASGTSISTTIEAGRIGNEKPITTVHETWFSDELKLNLVTTRDDPQMGQNTMRLINIRIGEPDPLLFQIPADYTVKDNP